MPDLINPLDILEKAGVDKFCINYAKKIVRLDKNDMPKIMCALDERFFEPVAFAQGGWLFTAEETD